MNHVREREAGRDLYEAFVATVPGDRPVRLEAHSLDLFEQIEREAEVPVIDLFDALRFETPVSHAAVRAEVRRRIVYRIARAAAEREGAKEPLRSFRSALEAYLALDDGDEMLERAFLEGRMDGTLGAYLRTNDGVRAAYDLPLSTTPGAGYRNEIDLAMRFAETSAAWPLEKVTADLARADEAFLSSAVRFTEGSAHAAGLAVLRMEIILLRELADDLARRSLKDAFEAEVARGSSDHIALLRAREACGAAAANIPLAQDLV